MKSWPLRIAGAAVVLVLLALLVVLFRPPPAPAPLPSPNGYDDFVQAAAALPEDNASPDYRQWTREELATRIAASSNTFALVNAGMQKECRVPPFPPSTGNDVDPRMTRLASFKRLAFALAARSRLAGLEARTNDAVEASLDGVQFAHGIARGGVMIEALVGFACEAIALQSLSGATISELDATTARSAARRLAALDAKAPALGETLASEHAYARSHGLYGVIMATVDRFDVGPSVPARKKFESKWTVQATRRRELILQLARRAFEVEHGSPPKTDTELVPGILTVLPTIPAPSGKQE